MGRKACGVELKPSYYRQAKKNLQSCEHRVDVPAESSLLDFMDEESELEEALK
jgi:hypothetical protein